MSFDLKNLDHVLKLANLDLPKEEVTQFQGQLQHILSYIDCLNELDLKELSPTSYLNFNLTPMRNDEVIKKFDFDLKTNAPQLIDNSFVVPKILAE